MYDSRSKKTNWWEIKSQWICFLKRGRWSLSTSGQDILYFIISLCVGDNQKTYFTSTPYNKNNYTEINIKSKTSHKATSIGQSINHASGVSTSGVSLVTIEQCFRFRSWVFTWLVRHSKRPLENALRSLVSRLFPAMKSNRILNSCLNFSCEW